MLYLYLFLQLVNPFISIFPEKEDASLDFALQIQPDYHQGKNPPNNLIICAAQADSLDEKQDERGKDTNQIKSNIVYCHSKQYIQAWCILYGLYGAYEEYYRSVD